MKKGPFKMKGPSGFKKLTPKTQQAYSDTIMSGMRNRPGYDSLSNRMKQKIKDARKRLGGYVATEKEMTRSLNNLKRSGF
tara:strand:- start:37 stop:276 length:240 start_codon:yes stop_codon:yes gene_type:complete